MKSELITIKQAVREVLEECPKARNSDLLLWLLVNRKMGNKIWIDDMNSVVHFESCRRARQFWQNTKGYCIPEEDIDALRNKRELEFKEVFRWNVLIVTV